MSLQLQNPFPPSAVDTGSTTPNPVPPPILDYRQWTWFFTSRPVAMQKYILSRGHESCNSRIVPPLVVDIGATTTNPVPPPKLNYFWWTWFCHSKTRQALIFNVGHGSCDSRTPVPPSAVDIGFATPNSIPPPNLDYWRWTMFCTSRTLFLPFWCGLSLLALRTRWKLPVIHVPTG